MAASEKPMLRQIEWGVQNGSITKNGLLPLIRLSFWKLTWVWEPLINSRFNGPIAQI